MIYGNDGKLIYRYDSEIVQIEAWGENALRVRATQNSTFTGRNWALDSKDAVQGEVSVQERVIPPEQCYRDMKPVKYGRIINGKLCAEVDEHGVLCFKNNQDKLLLKELARNIFNDISAPFKSPSREYKAPQGNLYETYVRFYPNKDEKIFGMGQYQQHEMDMKGCILELAQRNSQVSVPFYVSNVGYGFLWNNPAIGRVVFGNNMTEWEAEATPEIDYLVIAGDSPAEIQQNYMRLTGLPPMMPEYGMGFWQCKLRYATQEELLTVARRYKELGIQLDVIVCDFFHWTREGDFKFDPKHWPDPVGMCRELKDMGIRLMVSIWPTVSKFSENYKEMMEKGYLTRCVNGVRNTMDMIDSVVFFDATNPEARDYVWNKVKTNYWDKGAQLYWLDVAEPEYGTFDYRSYYYSQGGDLEVGNVYPKLYLKAFYDGMTENGDEKPISLIRSAWVGSAKYGALVWSGDILSSFECFARQVQAGLNMSIAGIPWWTTDIGGFHGGDGENPLFRELFARWFAYGCFCPVMRLHGSREHGHAVEGALVGSGGDNEIWSFGDEIFSICKKYISLREQMRPYIREQMKTLHETGTPVMRPMFYDYPQDGICWNLKTQYMFGPDFIVAPVMEAGVREIDVYLPEGQWKNIDTGTIHEGNTWVTVPAPLDIIPVFKRV
ncbi:MAG: glycoside hydrolase family 31 protein [Clostridia bacterium]|nr:glycoside hydrolase family 31 protein [Clostridia bacterium]